ncbi:glycoside hydrolase family 3 C-terminal domain-containing protein [Allofournierella massiliensis]|uniref:Glycoside hydrolase family 3 C-terminal domain-containing protein n=1 Tax=Allofournierella massiliensis TaxID=1650663 RepID=A0ABT7USN4_9FIRM|nr:glycoside hydrolase family 3 N-terminal domain-containing protein [Fournierella massiliensis]MDM8201898.1 glycoside hydrolase family 3 C-terminal domain-containing protein [Fournierella massiliensis]
MLSINIDDVFKVLDSMKYHLIGFGVVLVLAIIAMIACMKLPKAKKAMIRCQAGLAILLALVITVNLICFGPMNTMISLATGSGSISEETSAEATELVEDIADEGIVLLQNDDNTLPLTAGNLNVFGWASTNPVYGGTGSGALNDAYHTVTLLEGLENAGFTLNTELSDFYTAYRADRPTIAMGTQDWTLPEPPASTYTDEMIANAKAFSDTALVVISRSGGEGADLPTDMAAVIDGSWQDGTTSYAGSYTNNSTEYADFEQGQHYLELSKTERDMLDLVCSNFENVIVVYNGANTMELGFVDDYAQIKSVLWCPGTGQSGFNALGSILAGTVNPSGKTADTFVYDLTATPTWNNFHAFSYTNADEFAAAGFMIKSTTPRFINYNEGIYVGYRFYETAAAEGVIDYATTVQYPFGYGLSYTSFSQTMSDLTVDGEGNISLDVTVTNTGSVAGKDVVEVYYNPPYTNGGIEKATANLIAFDKTETLEPGASETITITFKAEDMASYDDNVNKAYVLEAGDYIISINSDSHTVIDSRTYNVAETIVYGEGSARSTDQTVATNQFEFAEGDVTYLSRADGFANYAEATAAPASYEMSDELKASFINNGNYDPSEYNNADDQMPTTGAKNGLQLVDMRGVDYDDAQWDTFLDQLTISDMDTLIALGGYQTAAVPSIGKVQTYDCDGPASINNNFTGVGSVGFPSAVMIASTWNQDLANEFGRSIGKMADEMNTTGWYAPAMNNHRSAFAGRNFEYYSEDGVLSGKMAAKAIQGAEEFGVYAYMKHFALNDQEANRCDMLCTWADEQAIREIYLKPFEISVKEGGCDAVMSSFNYIGHKWAGACDELLNKVLRDEWGFVGMVLTDYFGVYGYMDADQAIRNGTDFCLVNYDTETNHVTDTTSATSVLAMRQASKNILYTAVNSRAYAEENLNTGMLTWQIAAIAIDVVLAAVLIVLEVRTIKGYNRRKALEVQTQTNTEA